MPFWHTEGSSTSSAYTGVTQTCREVLEFFSYCDNLSEVPQIVSPRIHR